MNTPDAAPPTPATPILDVLVAGGGAAGLAAAVTLARFRRSVAVVDAGRPRNAPAEGIHALLGREGISPAASRPRCTARRAARSSPRAACSSPRA